MNGKLKNFQQEAMPAVIDQELIAGQILLSYFQDNKSLLWLKLNIYDVTRGNNVQEVFMVVGKFWPSVIRI